MKRSKHTLSHYQLRTANMGNLIPIGCQPVLPGDTFDHRTDVLVRCSPLNTPVMHPTQVRIHHWFIPYRILWSGWEDFITGGASGQAQPAPPQLTVNASTDAKSVAAYCGIPNVDGLKYNAFPVRAYNKVFNTRYRDQDLVPARPEDSNFLQSCAWEKDPYTTARPWTQRGPDVVLPIAGGDPPIYTDAAIGNNVVVSDGAGGGRSIEANSLNTPTVYRSTAGTGNIYADFSNISQVSVNEFRTGFALQRYQEARARYGARFTEYLRYLGITPSDARLQEPEFLGGGTARLNFSEVLQTANDPNPAAANQARTNYGVGDMYGHGIAGVRTNRYRKFFEEHGVVLTLLSVRPKSMYMQHCPREWLKQTKEDYFQKELAHIGQQEVFQAEINGTGDQTVFGYQDRYYEYRRTQSQVANEFLTLLAPYHIGRDLSGGATLNDGFVKCVPSDRVFQVAQTEADTLWIMANHHLVARRLVPKVSNPRIM